MSGRFGFSANTFSRSSSLAAKRLLVARRGIDQHALFEIEHPPAHANTRAGTGGRAGRTAEHALYAREQFPRLERLCDVVVRPGLEPDHAVDRIHRGRHHDDADAPGALAQPAREDEAVLARQPDVEQHQRGKLALEQFAQRRPAIGSAHAKVLLAEIVDQQLPLRRLILDDNNMRAMIHAAESPCQWCTAKPSTRRPVVPRTVYTGARRVIPIAH